MSRLALDSPSGGVGMKHFIGIVILISALSLVGCASLKPEDYGFQRVAITGQEYYCAPRQWVLPPVVAQDATNDPLFPLYQQFLTLPDREIVSAAQTPTREVCITQAQWLTMRTQWNRDWAVTPGT